ncbi:MAG: hypothetical protein WB540_05275 [Pseudolabrys sp.]
MTKLMILMSLAAITVGVQVQVAIADDVPKFDIRKSCKADVQAYQSNADGQASSAACLKDEEGARMTLVSQWTQFAQENRTRCVRMVGDGAASQSYVELLTCLQIAKDVKTLPKN